MPPSGMVYVDDDDALRVSVQALVESVELRAVTFASPRAFLAAPLESSPACLILDLRLPEMGGMDVLAELRRREHQLPVIVLTAYGAVGVAVQALKSGVFDFLEKPFETQNLLDRIQAAIAADEVRRRQREREEHRRARLASLSEREREVLEMVVGGFATKSVARRLNISTKTVEYHRANIFNKLRVENVVQLVRFVLGVGLPSLEIDHETLSPPLGASGT